MRAIVVDDSRAMRGILKRALTSLGFEVLEAADGQAALQLLQSAGAVELGLIDWNMPGMNGPEVIAALRADPAFAATKLVMVTTEVEMSHVAAALAAGANEYIMKPFTEAVLKEKLELLGVARVAA